ncbi:ATPase [Sphingomonas xanthus]|uniref:ATPase n=1 Tax=Sphingomonas xanthus TaxID=2594473 RepID=A0A516IQN0_9SPHN|nr:ATPase [Sphingomonas xanthus]QDP19074.1 ATPase [Sphingomonas xanthus]
MRNWIVGFALLGATPVAAEVVSAGPHGFEVRQSANLVVPQADAFAAFTQVAAWWHPDHSYSGDSSRLSLTPRAGGCFCESLENGGGVEHLRVTYVQPGERMVLTGSLGPLLFEGTAGAMDVKVERIAGGSRIVMTYRVAGFANGNGEALAGPVDRVLAEQMKRLRTFAAGGAPKR